MSPAFVPILRTAKVSWHIALPISLLLALIYRPQHLSSPNESTTSRYSPPHPSPLSPPAAPLSNSSTHPETVFRSELHSRVHHLATFSAFGKNGAAGVNRPFLSPEGHQARKQLLVYMADAGLTSHIDPAGNVVGRITCSSLSNRKALALGSHFDSVRGGGKWDGAFGVLAAIAVAKVINAREGGLCALPFDIMVVAFDDEEGNNAFGTTNFGAKAFAGLLDIPTDVLDFPELARSYAAIFPHVKEGDGSLEDNVAASVATAAVESHTLLAFLELHIEQGPVLERRGFPVGVVDAIAGQTRLMVNIRGAPGHAGTVPMNARMDSLAAAAIAVTVVEKYGRQGISKSLVATVGMLHVEPGSTNVIPGLVRFSIDIRAPDDAVRLRAVNDILSAIKALEIERGVTVSYEKTHEVSVVSMTPWVREALEDLHVTPQSAWPNAGLPETGTDNCSARSASRDLDPVSVKTTTLTSGAGHDTQFMSEITDVGMLFVRCRGGVSHHVDEHVADEDSYQGARALLKAVDSIAWRVANM